MSAKNWNRIGGPAVYAGRGVSWAAGLALVVLLLMARVSPPIYGQDFAASTGAETGVPWVGEVGITETVDEIMIREAFAPDIVYGPAQLREPEPREMVYPDRSVLPQNPDSPTASQWPPAGTVVSTASPAVPTVPTGAGLGLARGGGPLLPQTVGTSFLGAQSSESGFVPPDSMGAVGIDQVLVIVNGRIKVFDKNGNLGALNASTNTFFNSVRNGSTTSDPRVRFDRLSNRWFLSMVNVSTPNRILLAVSSGPTITGQASFTFFQFQHDLVSTTPNSDTGGFADYDTLGVDANAAYVGDNVFNAAGTAFLGTTGFVIQKASLLSGGPIVVTAFRQLATASGAGPFSPGGADNDDPNATEGYFVGTDNASLGRVTLRRVATPGGTPSISGNLFVTVPSTANPISVPALGNTGNRLDALDDRHYNAMVHRDRIADVQTLWLAHSIQVNASGVASSSGGRDGSRWYQIENLTTTPTLLQAGTLFSSAASNPSSFWLPTVAMSGQGHMALGCSAAGAVEHAEIAAAGRLATDPLGSTQTPTIAQTTSTVYSVQTGVQRWGDFSHTVVDPADDQTMWTFQEYCNATNSWGVRAIKLSAPPPAQPASCAPASVPQGSSLDVVVTGTSTGGSGFYDTDDSYSNRLHVSVNGIGVTINSITFDGPTQITLNVTVAVDATLGARDITATNPDGQSNSSAGGILTITSASTPPLFTTQPQDQAACTGGSASFNVVATGSPPLSYQWRLGTTNLFDVGNLSGATTPTLTINPVGPSDAAGNYNCVVTDGLNLTVTSNNAALAVDVGPAITVQPAYQRLVVNGTASFSVTATGTGALSYQWRKSSAPLADGGSISGATTATLTINPLAAGDAGNYDAVVTNSCGSVTSALAGLWQMGDINCDGAVNFKDINPFVLALTNSSAYASAYPGCPPANGDVNGDGSVNFKDINPFVALLTGQ